MKLLNFLFDSVISIEKNRKLSSLATDLLIFINLEREWYNPLYYRGPFNEGDRVKIVHNSRIYNPYINNVGELATIEFVGPTFLYVKTDSGGSGNIDIVAAEKI